MLENKSTTAKSFLVLKAIPFLVVFLGLVIGGMIIAIPQMNVQDTQTVNAQSYNYSCGSVTYWCGATSFYACTAPCGTTPNSCAVLQSEEELCGTAEKYCGNGSGPNQITCTWADFCGGNCGVARCTTGSEAKGGCYMDCTGCSGGSPGPAPSPSPGPGPSPAPSPVPPPNCAPVGVSCDTGCSPSVSNCQNQCPAGATWCFNFQCISCTPPPPPPPPQCSDGVDNDGDGYRDYPNDPGCSSASDNTELARLSVTLRAVPALIQEGGSSRLVWTVGSDIALSCRISDNNPAFPDIGPVSTWGGSQPISPPSTIKYTLTCANGAGPVSASTVIYLGKIQETNP